MVKVAIITYSTYGHIDALAKAVQQGIQEAGGNADIFRVPETLSDDVLEQMNAPPKPTDVPIATEETLVEYDAFLFGVPTRFGNLPAQWSAFWDRTGRLWAQGDLNGKIATFFLSTSSYGGGQESTVKNCLSYLAHHGIIYVPLGYRDCFAELANIDELHGGSPWGAGTLAGADGSRSASDLEKRVASIQGKTFYQTALKFYPSINDKPATAHKDAAAAATANKRTTKPATKKAAAPAAAADKPEDKKKEEGLLSCCSVM
ncbi:hypothetical protein MOSE0_H07184 [Monosporozyma servazzii]